MKTKISKIKENCLQEASEFICCLHHIIEHIKQIKFEQNRKLYLSLRGEAQRGRSPSRRATERSVAVGNSHRETQSNKTNKKN